MFQGVGSEYFDFFQSVFLRIVLLGVSVQKGLISILCKLNLHVPIDKAYAQERRDDFSS